MPLELLPLILAALLGLRLQRWSGSERLRERLWHGNYVVVLPLAATYAFLSIDLDAQLAAVVSCGVIAWWLTILASYGWARLVARSRTQRGALTLIGGFPNTGFIGYPLAQFAFGSDGLRLAVIYDQVGLVVPQIVVALVIARHHATSRDASGDARSIGSLVRQELLTSLPLWTVLVLVALRLTVLPDPVDVSGLGSLVGAIVGPIGFLLLGLSMPLHGFDHRMREVVGVVGAALLRVAGAPAILWLVARATTTDLPDAYYLLAALPTAFHVLVVARLRDLEVSSVRLGVLVTTVLTVGATVGWVALHGT